MGKKFARSRTRSALRLATPDEMIAQIDRILGAWKSEVEATACARFTLEIQLAAVQLDEPTRDIRQLHYGRGIGECRRDADTHRYSDLFRPTAPTGKPFNRARSSQITERSPSA